MIAEVEGEVEDISIVGTLLYVLTKDVSTESNGKYWLNPHTLHIFDPLRVDNPEVKNVKWTQRQGKIIGFNQSKNEIYFVVTDNDDPAVWIIENTETALTKAYWVIK